MAYNETVSEALTSKQTSTSSEEKIAMSNSASVSGKIRGPLLGSSPTPALDTGRTNSINKNGGRSFENPMQIPEAVCGSGNDNARTNNQSQRFNFEKWIAERFRDSLKCRTNNIGVAFQNLNVYGFSTITDYQKTVANYPLVYSHRFLRLFGEHRKSRIDILRDFEGIVRSGELVMVLGKPGSGCSTLLKTLAGRTHGFSVDSKSQLNYQGVSRDIIHSELRGECSYQAESDFHFPHLTVAQTLKVPAEARMPANAIVESNRKLYAHDAKCAAAQALGLSGVLDVKIGNNSIEGVSGGERQRTSLAEVLLCGTFFQCWDNSTRGLDSANALNFVRVLRKYSEVTNSAHVVTMYQASQQIYDLFDKVTLLYEGRQIYFGPVDAAKTYFTKIGFTCPDHTSTSDFLTSITNKAERLHLVRPGFEHKVPRNPDEFASMWKQSIIRKDLTSDIAKYNEEFPLNRGHLGKIRVAQKVYKGNVQGRSPYTMSLPNQISLCLNRGFQRLMNDLTPPLSGIAGNTILSIILGSIFYNLPENTSSFFGRGVLIFFAVLTNTFLGAFEGVQLWDQRPIVEKHFQYALYRPSAEAIASMICDLPNKLLLTTFFNIPFYFLANMRRTPSAFFTFYLFAFVSLLTGSMLFRTIGAISKTLTSSIAPGSGFILMLVTYTGFVVPVPNMHPWFRWFRYLDPVGYVFESLMINEFSGRQFACAHFIPQGPGYGQKISSGSACVTVGSVPGSEVVHGDTYLAQSFGYRPENLWRNLGIIFSITFLLFILYLIATEYISTQRSKGEVLIFRRGHLPAQQLRIDEELQASFDQPVYSKNHATEKYQARTVLQNANPHAAVFLWDNLCYDVHAKGGTKRILDNIEGWIKPGTLTALMGASGAGKTTLLNVLANRTTTGVIGGSKLVNSKYQNNGFTRKVGYAQQEDLHLETSTVREALIFSARLRQPPSYSDAEKIEWVDRLIQTLDMSGFAEAVIGVPGEGLNVEQRKRVTIGVQLAARPELLLFLDEPTSGLDSNTAWSICKLLKKLASEGQDILCTIHQPTSTIFQMFDRLLFLHEGKSIYFGELGPDSRTLIDYFERNGADKCSSNRNPAEWLLETTQNPKFSWVEKWQTSDERKHVKNVIQSMKKDLSTPTVTSQQESSAEFATSFFYQMYIVTRRNFERDWRTPSYLYSKIFLTLLAGLINGFSFYHSPNSLQGVQNQVFSVFLLFLLHSNAVQLVLPHFLKSLELYETRERPSRTYSWTVFLFSNIIAELPWQTVLAVVQFLSWYYPLGMYRNALTAHECSERSGLMFLLTWSFMIFSTTFSQMLGTIAPDAATGINISALLYGLSLIFCGVLVPPGSLPKFWIFMYRVTPITYFLDAMVSTGIAGVNITCAANEILEITPPSGQTCGIYLQEYMTHTGGSLLNPDAADHCQFCPVANTDTLVAALGIFYDHRWRSFGITLAFSVINVACALFLYWLLRVPKRSNTLNELKQAL